MGRVVTTIAYRDGIIASDTAVFDGTSYQHEGQKMFRVGPNIIAGAGNYEAVLAFVEWIKSGQAKEDKPNVGDDFEAVVVNARAAKWYGKLLFGAPQGGGYWALGSGTDFALAAMDAGASAKQAVKIAINRDIRSGGKAVVMKVAS